jgi:hypothetical protein
MPLDFIGDLITTGMANRGARARAREQMQFQERMSNTAYQRAVADMREAGLNPMLAYGKGASASTPAGAMAQTLKSNAKFPAEMRLLREQAKNLKTTNAHLQQQTDTSEADEINKKANTAKALAEARRIKVNTAHDQIKAGIDGRTLNYLSSNSLSMPQVQYTAFNQATSEGWDWMKARAKSLGIGIRQLQAQIVQGIKERTGWDMNFIIRNPEKLNREINKYLNSQINKTNTSIKLIKKSFKKQFFNPKTEQYRGFYK